MNIYGINADAASDQKSEAALFLRNLLLDEKNELNNRTMHISGLLNMISKADIGERRR